MGLKIAPVSHEAEDDADAAGIINAVPSDCIDQFEGLQAAGFKSAAWLQVNMTIEDRVFTGMG